MHKWGLPSLVIASVVHMSKLQTTSFLHALHTGHQKRHRDLSLLDNDTRYWFKNKFFLNILTKLENILKNFRPVLGLQEQFARHFFSVYLLEQLFFFFSFLLSLQSVFLRIRLDLIWRIHTSFKEISTPGQIQTGLGPRVYTLLLPQTAVLPGSDASSDVIKPASSFVIQNRQTSCSMWCPMYRARC